MSTSQTVLTKLISLEPMFFSSSSLLLPSSQCSCQTHPPHLPAKATPKICRNASVTLTCLSLSMLFTDKWTKFKTLRVQPGLRVLAPQLLQPFSPGSALHSMGNNDFPESLLPSLSWNVLATCFYFINACSSSHISDKTFFWKSKLAHSVPTPGLFSELCFL